MTPRSPRRKPREQEAAHWVRERLGKGCFAPFTGQDWRAWAVWIHALELWFGADGQGQEWALEALRCALCAMQPKCWPVCKAAIPAIGDWSHEDELWYKLELVTPSPSSDPPRHPRATRSMGEIAGLVRPRLELVKKPEGDK